MIDGTWELVARNDRLVLPEAHGGVAGDPYQSVSTGPRSFRIAHSGGDSDKWTLTTEFAWSAGRGDWVLADERSHCYGWTMPEGGTWYHLSEGRSGTSFIDYHAPETICPGPTEL